MKKCQKALCKRVLSNCISNTAATCFIKGERTKKAREHISIIPTWELGSCFPSKSTWLLKASVKLGNNGKHSTIFLFPQVNFFKPKMQLSNLDLFFHKLCIYYVLLSGPQTLQKCPSQKLMFRSFSIQWIQVDFLLVLHRMPSLCCYPAHKCCQVFLYFLC